METAMAYDTYKLLRVTAKDRVVTAVIDNPPINLITLALYDEFVRISKELEADDDALVFVLKSADPEFFIAHFDVSALVDYAGRHGRREARPAQRIPRHVRTLPHHGQGHHRADRRPRGRRRLGARGLVRHALRREGQDDASIRWKWPSASFRAAPARSVGRVSSAAAVRSKRSWAASTSMRRRRRRWGYLNRALEASEIEGYVAQLAARIASFPAPAVRLAKRAIDASALPIAEGLAEEAFLFQCLMREPSARAGNGALPRTGRTDARRRAAKSKA